MTSDRKLLLQQEAKEVIKHGYMPQDNKNLITFTMIATLYAITTAAAFTFGFQLRANTAQNNLNNSLQEYRMLEAEIISTYEARHGLPSTIDNNNIPLYKYYNQDGISTPIYATPSPSSFN